MANRSVLNSPSIFDDEAVDLPVIAPDAVRQIYDERSMAELAALDRQQRAIERRQYGTIECTDIGLVIGEGVTRQDWDELGVDMFAEIESVNWRLGDWLAFGEDVGWGDIPKIAAERGRNKDTLANYASVSRLVQFSLRHENLSYSHHVVVARADLTDEQKHYWLDQAEMNGWKVRQLRAEIETWENADEDNPPALPGATTVISDGEAQKIIKEMAKLRQKPRESYKNKDVAVCLGYAEMLERYAANIREWVGGAGEEAR